MHTAEVALAEKSTVKNKENLVTYAQHRSDKKLTAFRHMLGFQTYAGSCEKSDHKRLGAYVINDICVCILKGCQASERILSCSFKVQLQLVPEVQKTLFCVGHI